MLIALTGTPGTGKTSVTKFLEENGYNIIDLNKLSSEKGFILEKDTKRDTYIINLKKLDEYIFKNYKSNHIFIIDSHLSHLLKSVDKVIILRCHPKILRERLKNKKWKEEKNKENIEAEILDIILCETIEIHPKENIFEINTTKMTTDNVGEAIIEIIDNNFTQLKNYKIGSIDWSEEIFKEFQMDGLD